MVGFRGPVAFLAATFALLPASPLRAAGPARTLWPWAVRTSEATVTLYQPQVDRWADDVLEGRAAVAAVKRGEKEPTYGVVWLRSRTAPGGLPGEVTLKEIAFAKASFPWESDGGAAILDTIRQEAGMTATLPLASLNASPAVALAQRRETAPSPPAPEPRVIHARGPAVLVLVDGPYDIRPVPGTTVLRVVNTRSLLLQDSATSRFYLPVGHVWLVAPAPNGRWRIAKKLPQGLESVRKTASAEPGVELFERPAEGVAALLRAGKAPEIIVSTTPAVLASKASRPEKARPEAVTRAGRPAGLYAGPDGNVYRPRAAGGWEKTNGRDWYPVQERAAGRGSRPSGLVLRLDAERRARAAGTSGHPSGSHPPS